MRYFTYLPKIKYTFETGEYTVPDLFTKVILNDNFFNNDELYYEEQLETPISPEKLSLQKYEKYDHYWLLLLANKIIDVNKDWPETQEDFGLILEQNSKKSVYYIYDNIDAMENDVLYVNEYSYGIIESWNPFDKSIVIKEDYNLPTNVTDVTFKVKRIINGKSIDLYNTCLENNTNLTAFGYMKYLNTPSKFMLGAGKNVNPFSKIVSGSLSSDLLLDTCSSSDKTQFQSSVIYRAVNNQSIGQIKIETQEDRLLKEFAERIKINIVNGSFVSMFEDKIKLMFNDPTAKANTITRIG